MSAHICPFPRPPQLLPRPLPLLRRRWCFPCCGGGGRPRPRGCDPRGSPCRPCLFPHLGEEWFSIFWPIQQAARGIILTREDDDNGEKGHEEARRHVLEHIHGEEVIVLLFFNGKQNFFVRALTEQKVFEVPAVFYRTGKCCTVQTK